jgi:branched-chain amino acid transport system substrate-binding protein
MTKGNLSALLTHKLTRREFLVSTLALGVGVALGCEAEKAPTTPTTPTPVRGPRVKLGYISTLSGVAAPVTQPELQAIQFAVEEINSAGGVLGRPIELIARDDKGRPEEATRLARELVEAEGVFLLMGVISSGVALAVSEYAKSARVPFIDTIAQTAALTEEKGHRYVFRVIPTHTGIAGRGVAEVAAKQPWRRWYFIGPDYEYGHRMVEDFRDHLKKLRPDVEFLGELWPKFGKGEYSAEIGAILAARPEAVFTSLWGTDWIAFVKQAKGFGYFDKVQQVSWAGAEPDVSIPLGADFPPRILTGSSYLYYAIKTPENEEFVRKFINRTGQPPLSGAAYGYVSVQVIKAAVEKAGAWDREKFIDALEGIRVKTIIGDVEVRKCDHQLYGPFLVGFTGPVPGTTFHGIVSDVTIWSLSDVLAKLALPCEEVQRKRGG